MTEARKNKDLPNLFRAVGEAISTWSTVELQLSQIFGVCTSLVVMQPGGGFSYDDEIPNAVLNSIDGFNGRLRMIDAAMMAALSELDDEARAILVHWRVVHSKVRKLHDNRNCLAHWRASSIYKGDGTLHRVAITQPSFKRSEEFATETDIGDWQRSFTGLAGRLSKIVSRLASHRGLQRKHLERAVSQVLCTLPNDPALLEHLKHQLSDHLKS